tara:strand:- start:1573 stop:3672 length:2100 start_codon:yes stop_codon:yes gene_type:complete
MKGRATNVDHQIKLMEKYVQLMEHMIKNGEKLSKAQIQAINNNAKEFRRFAATEKIQTVSLKKAVMKNKLSAEELKVRERLKSADESLVRLRSNLRMQEEREHGSQVRRNIVLRDKQMSFNNSLAFAKNALTGGFGFSSALGTAVKGAARLTKKFNDVARSTEALSRAHKKYDKTRTDTSIATMAGGSSPNAEQAKKIKEAEIAEGGALGELQSQFDETIDTGKDGGAVEGKMKPMFSKLSKLGDFLSKKAVPIGLGIGVAGVLMSVIVKAFSASPLFAQMMKMMKFMVTLILMPIGTFFGALLRPILVILLRKFIVPMYSKWMPIMMKAGEGVGKLVAWFIDGMDFENDATLTENQKQLIRDQRAEIAANPDVNRDNMGVYTVSDQQQIVPAEKDNKFLGDSTSVSDGGQIEPTTSTDDVLKDIKDGVDDFNEAQVDLVDAIIQKGNASSEVPIQSNADFIAQTAAAHGLGEAELIIDEEAMEKAAGMYPVDQEEKDRAAARAELEAEAKAEREKPQNDMNRLMNEIIETGTSMVETMPKVLREQEMTNFAAYGTQDHWVDPDTGLMKDEKGGDIKNAGISMTQDEIDKKNEGYQGYGGVNSTLDSSGRSSQSIMDNYNAYLAGVVPAANGFNGMVNKPTMFLAGEAGSEHVSVTPNGGSGGITVNIQNMNGSDNDLRKLKKTILEVIQESSVNRGRL